MALVTVDVTVIVRAMVKVTETAVTTVDPS